MKNSTVTGVISVLLVSALLIVNAVDITDECLGCICQASTGCNKDQGCNEGGVCGPFLITWGFWSDSGKPVIAGTKANDPDAYKKCVNDLFCASESIRNYVKIFGKDCNGDGAVDCEDIVRIHKFGPGACENPSISETTFYKEFTKCKSVVNPK